MKKDRHDTLKGCILRELAMRPEHYAQGYNFLGNTAHLAEQLALNLEAYAKSGMLTPPANAKEIEFILVEVIATFSPKP